MRHDQDFDERPPKRKHYMRCHDRMCGALDCPTCYPLTYMDDHQPDEEPETVAESANDKVSDPAL